MSTLRDALEAAVAEHDKSADPIAATPAPAPAPEPAPAPADAIATEGEVDDGQKELLPKDETDTGKVAPTPAPKPTDTPLSAPQSWKPAARSHWDKIPVEARTEIQRREREVTRVLGESSQAREFHKQFQEVVRPFEGRIRANGLTAVQAVDNLLKTDYTLAHGTSAQKAQLAAQLIRDYGVDIRELDAALAGSGAPADPVQSAVEKLLEQRLAPINQFVQTQLQQEQRRNQEIMESAVTTIEQMATDSVKYPHFDQVREDMADLVEISAKRGVYLSPEQAYTRAVAMNPELSAAQSAQDQARRQADQARMAHARAQKALGASASVSGRASGSPVVGGSSGGSLRETIEAAFESVSGR